MSDVFVEDEHEDDDPNESSVIKTLRKQQRDQAAELKTLREQADAGSVAIKENALYKAKLDGLNDAQRNAVLATTTDATAEAFRAQAEALGFVEPAKPDVAADELAAQDRIANAGTGGTDVDPANYDAEIGAANTAEEVFAIQAKYGRSIPVTD